MIVRSSRECEAVHPSLSGLAEQEEAGVQYLGHEEAYMFGLPLWDTKPPDSGLAASNRVSGHKERAYHRRLVGCAKWRSSKSVTGNCLEIVHEQRLLAHLAPQQPSGHPCPPNFMSKETKQPLSNHLLRQQVRA